MVEVWVSKLTFFLLFSYSHLPSEHFASATEVVFAKVSV